jgi:hypothetical protein
MFSHPHLCYGHHPYGDLFLESQALNEGSQNPKLSSVKVLIPENFGCFSIVLEMHSDVIKNPSFVLHMSIE